MKITFLPYPNTNAQDYFELIISRNTYFRRINHQKTITSGTDNEYYNYKIIIKENIILPGNTIQK